ncbi:DUF4097 family beta strand repeat-containing protein [Streptomyces sp. NPDC089799]|uniref:DUF4097 family beta strand repeat-containing protein n=1 Tax=Streptomyces sp. NPDC089799 TaxID=3155066 RepID=UPI0034450458
MTADRTSRPRPAAAATAVGVALAVAAGLLLTSGCSLLPGDRKTAVTDAEVTAAVTAVDLRDTGSGDITVTPGDGPGVAVHRTIRYRGGEVPTTGQRVAGGVLTFGDGDCDGDCSIDYELRVPASATVKLRSSSGDITVTGVAAADLHADSGDVRADRIAGALKVRTSSGDIAGTALAGPDADAQSSSGDARLEFTAAPRSVSANTSSGDVTLRLPGGPYRVDTRTDSGDREVSVPTDPAAEPRLTVKTSSGDVRIGPRGV